MKLTKLKKNCRTALITGASSGMGLIFARRLAEEGMDLVLVSNQDEELKKVAAELSAKYSVKADFLCQDLAKQDSAEELFAWCRGRGHVIDILINNAGMFFFKELDEGDLNRVATMINLHNMTVVKASILFGCDMKKRGFGYILNMSSMAAKLPAPGITVYCATKSFLKTFGKAFSFEMNPHGIGVTTVCPAAIATPLYNLREDLLDFGVKIGVIKRPEWLVNRALRAMQRRKRLLRPGAMNVYLPTMLALFPGGLESSLWKKFR